MNFIPFRGGPAPTRVRRLTSYFSALAAIGLVLMRSDVVCAQSAEGKPFAGTDSIETVSSIMALPGATAAQNVPVKIKGVVTFFQRLSQLCFVQDGTAGIYVYTVNPKVDLTVGSLVEITGVTDTGRYSPIVREVSTRLLGQTNLPPAKPISGGDLRAGTEDAQWVQLRGVVLKVQGRVYLEILSGGTKFQAHVLEPSDAGITNLVDATVSIRGVAGAAYDAKGKITGFNVYVPGERFIEVIRRGSAGPFESPRVAVGDLTQFAHRRLQPHRVLVQGTVTARRSNGVFYLRDATGSIEVQPVQGGLVSPGDMVEAAGYLGDDVFCPFLMEAVFRKTESRPVPLPIKLTSPATFRADCENELISVEGTLLGFSGVSSNQISLLLSSGNRSITVTTESAGDIPALSAMIPGSVLRVTGIGRRGDPAGPSSKPIQVWLPQASQVEVIRTVHQWTGSEVMFWAGLAFFLPTAGFWLMRRADRRRLAEARDLAGAGQNGASRYDELFENASDVICTLEPTGRITTLNRAGISLLGYSEAEVRGLNISQLVVPSDWPRLRGMLEAKGKDTSAVPDEFELVARDGRHVFLQINARPVLENGRMTGVQAIARDVTERKRTEAELIRTAEGLQFSLAERERIGRDLHDSIIQSIYAVGLTLDDCRRNLVNAPEKAELRLEQGIDALNAVIREVRDYINGLGPVMLQAHELEGALKSLVLTMSSARTVRFSLIIEPGVVAMLDARQATEIFLVARELMSNCLRHSRASSARISIRSGREQAILRIEDDGVGFEVDARSPAGRGLRNISGRARDLGAEFQIESNPGAGSVFTLEVPVSKTRHQNEIQNPSTSAGG